MSNCRINTKKFKQFSLYNLSDGTLTTSNAPEYNHILQDSNKVFLVGYKFINATQCPEVKLRLEDVLAASNISLGFRLDPADQQVLQFTTAYDPSARIEDLPWQTAVTLPSGGSSCNCDLKLGYEESTGKLYYTLDGTTGLEDQDCPFVELPTSSGGTSTFTSSVDYGATNGPTAEFDSDGNFVIHLEPYPNVTGITGVGDLQLTTIGGQWNNASGAINTYTFYDTDGTAFNQTIQVKNGEDGDPGEVPTLQIKSDGHLWATYLNGSSNDLGEVQITNVSGGTYGIMNVKDVSLCTAAGDAYIDWNTSSSTYGHLFYYIDDPSSLGTSNNPNPQDLGKIVGSNGIGIDSVVPQGSVTHTSGGHNTYVVKGTDNSTLGTFDVYDGTNGTSIGAVYCVDNNAALPNNTTLSGEVIPSSAGGRINKYKIIDTNHQTLNYIYIANGVDGATPTLTDNNNGSFTMSLGNQTVSWRDGQDGARISLHKLVWSNITATQDSNTGLYNISGTLAHYAYNAVQHAFDTSITAPNYSSAQYVELCPSDTNLTTLATNLKYGIFGVFDSSNSNVAVHSIADPTADGVQSVELILKAYQNLW